MKAFRLHTDLLSNFNQLVASETKTAQQNFAQAQKSTALSQALFPNAVQLKSLDGANGMVISHFEALSALSTAQTLANVNAFFDGLRQAYASLVGLKIVPNSLIASAKVGHALGAGQNYALNLLGQLNTTAGHYSRRQSH